jgi:hypothetical protein
MASLYEIDQQILACLDPETGEIADPEMLDALMMERDAKIESVACWIKNLESDALAYKAEKEAFADREAAAKKKVESLKGWLAHALEGQKFSTVKCAVSFRKSESVELEEAFDVAHIPAEYLSIKTTYSPNKTAIKAAIKEGKEIAGCKLVEKLNASVK